MTHRTFWRNLAVGTLAGLLAAGSALGEQDSLRGLSARSGQAAHVEGVIKRIALPDSRSVRLAANGETLDISPAQPGGSNRILHLPIARRNASLTLLPSGRALIWGGSDERGKLIEGGNWLDLDSSVLSAADLPLSPRAGHSATVLTDGRVLFAGGVSGQARAELWDERSGGVALVARDADRFGHAASLQADGSVRLHGNVSRSGQPARGALAYEPEQARFVSVAPNTPPSTRALGMAGSLPRQGEAEVSPDAWPAVRFSVPVRMSDLVAGKVSLLGPGGNVAIRVAPVENGRLVFAKPLQALFPETRYTLMVDGVHGADGKRLPLMALDFKTQAVTLKAASDATISTVRSTSSPTTVVTGTDPDLAACERNGLYAPCREQGTLIDGVWSPGRDNTDNRWRIYGPQPGVEHNARIAHIARLYGNTVVRGRIVRVDLAPVQGVEVSIGKERALTDANGWFNLFEVPAGHQELYVDGSAANGGGFEYGQFVVGVQVKPRQLNELPYAMHLPRIVERDKIRIASPLQNDMVVGHPDIPGLQLHIPKGTVIHDRKGRLVTELAIVPTPVNRAPFPVMENHPMAFTVEPGGAQVRGLDPKTDNGIRVYYPNYDGHAAGTQANFWIYDPVEGWRVYGKGTVSQDRRFVVPERGVALHQTMGGMYSVPGNNGPTEPGLAPGNSGHCGNGCNGGAAVAGDPIDLKTGEFTHAETDAAISDVVPITIGRSYRPHDMQRREFGIGTTWNWGYTLHRPDTNTYDVIDLVLPNGSSVRFNRISGTGNQGEWRQAGSNTQYTAATLKTVYDADPAQPWGRAFLVTMRDGSRMQFSSYNDIRIRWIEDRYGNRTSLVYNSGLVSAIISPSGRSLAIEYDNYNRIQTVRDHTGREWTYAYNGNGLLAQVTYPDTTFKQYAYQTRLQSGSLVQHRIESITNQRGYLLLQNEFEVVGGVSTGRVIKQTRADGEFLTINYAHVVGGITGTLVTEADGSQRRIVFEAALPYPKSETFAYGTPQAQTYAYERDAAGQVTASIDPLGRRTEYVYNADGQASRITSLAGTAQARAVEMTYTADGDLSSVTDALDRTTTFRYSNRCLTSVTDALQRTATFTCNSAGRVIGIADPLGRTTTLTYDGYDLVATTDPLARTLRFRYDALGRLIASEDANGNIARREYDAMGRVKKSFDARGRATEFDYDANGNLEAVLLPNGNGVTYTYDERDRLLTRTDALSQAESWTYDEMDRVETHTDRRQQVTQFDYDALGRLVTTTYDDSSTATSTYDAGNRIVALVDSAAGTLGWDYNDFDELIEAVSAQGSVLYDYDVAGRRTQMIAASQAAVNYSYDDGDRLQAIQQGSETVEFDYDDIDRLMQQTLPNGVKSGYAYNDAGQVTGIAWLKADDSPLGDLGYGYDVLGRLVAQTGSFASDNLPAASTGANVFDDNNRQTQYNGATLTYDDNGNLTGDGAYTYVWNTRNQLIQVKQGANEIANYIYDPLGRRISRNFIGYTTTYLYDGVDPVQETMGGVVNPILTGLGIDQRFARNDVGGRTYFLTDHLGSTRALTNTAGNVVNRYDYSPYGETSESSALGYLNPYRYTGREADVAGLYYYRARYYQPEMGRFISEDSYGFAAGDNNFYAYALGNPVSYNDPSGHIVWLALLPIIWGGIEIAASLYDLYDTGKTLMNPCASGGQKALAVGLLLAGMVLPGGGYGLLDNAANKARGLSKHGGTFSSFTNSAGGEVITSSGRISQNDFSSYVNSGLYKGDVNIISGAHGYASGATEAAFDLYQADVRRFGNIPGVTVHNLPDMTPGQISDLMRGPGTTIGGFCDSAACLAPYR